MTSRVKFLVGLMAFTIVLRLIPYVLTNYDIKLDPQAIFYPWNFSPLMAISLYAGATISDRRLRFGLPLLTLILSDLAIWAVTGEFSWAFPSGYWSSYLCNMIAVLMGTGLRQLNGTSRMVAGIGCGISAEVIFFVVTNFVYFWTQTDLPHTLAGLNACYIAAIPFATKSFQSTLFYSALLFSPLLNRSEQKTTVTEPAFQAVHSV